jgi:PAS domain S-box-containing protein
MENYSHAIAQLKQETCLNYHQIFWQAVLNLQGQVNNPCCLQGVVYNEQQGLNRYLANNDSLGFQYFYINQLILCYLFGQFTQALKSANTAEGYLKGAPGQVTMPLFCFYDSLVRLAIYSHVPDSEQKVLFLNVSSNQKKMHKWARHAPMNFLHKYHLVEAEKARVLGQLLEAEKFYEQAIQGARENGYIQEEALAYELAAKHYLTRGLEKFAQLYMKEAHYCYERWGATAKVRNLEAHYPQFFPQSTSVSSIPIHTAAGTTSNTSHVALDLAAMMKASQAISSEIELEHLLHALMQILIENAGAQTGCLLLENAGEWIIEATCELIEGAQVCATQVLQSTPIANRLPESIIHYVIRTHESVILNDATRKGNFINDPYIQHHQTQSVFCLPLLNQSKLIGVLYLENQLATGAFTPERSQILHLLSTQAAIAIENAKLYSKLREGESRMTQFLEAIPVGIAVMDMAGCPYYFNQRATQLLGKGIDPSVTPDQLAEVYQTYLAGTNQKYPIEKMPIIQALSGKHTRVDDVEIHQSNAIIPVEVWGTPVFDKQGKIAYAIAAFQDITQRKQAEQLLANYNRTLEQQVAQRTAALQQSEAALRYREQQLQLITDALPVCISYVDANQCYQFVNQTYEDWFRCSREEILGKHTRNILGEAAYQVAQPYINQALAGQITIYEAEIPYPFGKRYISGSLIPDFDHNNRVRGYYGLITDISEQRNAALRERKRAEQASILEERNRMAREIHDTLAQAFTGILLHIGLAIELITKKPETAQTHMETIDELARTGLTEARRSVSALRLKLLEEGDLFSALKHLTTQMKSSTDTHIACEIAGTAYSLPPDVENHLLRIGQEALTNAIKYAHATEIHLELVYKERQCLLRVKDDGQGFAVDQISLDKRFGLLGMSERAEHIGGELIIKSQPGQGTEIVVIVNRE